MRPQYVFSHGMRDVALPLNRSPESWLASFESAARSLRLADLLRFSSQPPDPGPGHEGDEFGLLGQAPLDPLEIWQPWAISGAEFGQAWHGPRYFATCAPNPVLHRALVPRRSAVLYVQRLRYLVRVRSVPSGSNYMHEAQREVDDGGHAHHRENPRAIHAKRGAASTHARGARLDCVANALAPFIPQQRYVRGDHEEDRGGPRPPSR